LHQVPGRSITNCQRTVSGEVAWGPQHVSKRK
jgi:hypothetical protein